MSTSFSVDFPIEEATDDRLDRGPFAKLIGKALLAPNEKSASVIGLVGPWGTGKSSVANLIVNEVQAHALVVRFEPWIVTTREALALEFFSTLGRYVVPKGDDAGAKEKRARFYRYASKALGVLSIGASAVGTLVPGLTTAGSAGKSISESLTLAAEGMEGIATEPTLKETKDAISQDLAALKRPVIVVIDDIDRLDRSETKTMFQLVKACADFPNVRYLLLFDREQVVHALHGSVNEPEAFLEKIIGQAFDLPEATTKQRASLLDDALSELGLHEELAQSDMERLSMLFDEVLLPGLRTVRQVKRFVSTVRSLLPGVIVDGFRNIDPADFLALEFLRQFVPSLYSVLRDEQAPNPGGKVARIVHHKELPKELEKKRQVALDALDDPIKSLAREALDSLLKSNASEAVAHATKRFVTDYWKPVYFGFSDARASVKEADWAAFLAALESGIGLAEWQDRWEDRDTRDRWVTAICSRAAEITHRATLMTSLFRWGDAQSYEESFFMSTEHHPWSRAMSFCCTALLEATESEAGQIDLLRRAIDESSALVSPSLVIGIEVSRQEEEGWGQWAGGKDLSSLVQILQPRMAEEVSSGRVWSRPDPAELIHTWRYIDKNAHSAWHTSLTSDARALANYLNYYVGCHRDDKQLNDWQIDSDLLKSMSVIDETLLTEAGRWARQHCLDSAERIRRRGWPTASEESSGETLQEEPDQNDQE